MHSLIDLFFRYVTPFQPFVHRPTFEAQYADGLHERDAHYAHLLLMVAAVASIYSNDPRVYWENRGAKIPGYKFFAEVKDWQHTFAPVMLPDLQAIAVGL